MITKSTSIASKAIERKRRLETSSPTMKRSEMRSVSEAISRLYPLINTQVNQTDCDFAFNILEKVCESSLVKGKDIARYIANNIVLGITENTNIDIDDYNIPEECKNIIKSSIQEAAICNRIINNQTVLECRFNINKVVSDNRYNLEKIISEMCELIDTYNVPSDYKYNIALENIMYSLVKNNIEIPSDTAFVGSVTEYFMMRDMIIGDTEYEKYKTVLENCFSIFDIDKSQSILLESVLNHDPDCFRNRTITLLSSSEDPYISENLKEMVLNIQTEADASNYIEAVSDYVNTGCCKDRDEQLLYYSVSNIPYHTPVSKDFVTIKRKECLNNDRYDKLCTPDHIMDDIESILERDNTDKDIGIFELEKYKDIVFKEDSNSEKVDELIKKFKAEQDKSPSAIKRFFIRLHTKSPESIIDESPDIFSFVRAGILLAIAAATPIGPILAAVTGFVSWLISVKLNEANATNLLSAIRAEKKKVSEKIDKLSSDKKIKELEDYKKCLEGCEDKVITYLDKISDVDTTDDDELGDDIDFDLESAIIEVAIVTEMACKNIENIMQNPISEHVEDMVLYAAKNSMLGDLGYIITESSLPNNEYKDILEKCKSSSDNVIERTAYSNEIQKLNSCKESSTVRDIVSTTMADNSLMEIYEEVITEKFSLNTVKLALQNAKAKLKDLSTKEKSMWQSVDAAGSGLVKSVEKAMTSDRREAIIKGSILPSFSKCIKGAIALAGVGLVFGPMNAIIAAIGGLAVSKVLNAREKRLIFDEIDTELKVVEKEIEIAQNDGDMKKYRFLLNYQKKLTREYQRIRYGMKATGRNIPTATIPGKK